VRIAVATATALLAGLLACKNTMAPITQHTPPPADLRCAATELTLDSAYTGVLSASSACRAKDILRGESTYTRLYDLPLQAGRGYFVTMQPTGPMTGLLELTTADSASPTLLAASRDVTGRGELLWVAQESGVGRIRATTRNGSAADTGSFAIVARTCKVPVPETADFPVTHSDATTAADCEMSLAALNIGDNNVTNLHLYQVRSTSDTLARLVTFSASAPVRVFFGGPHEDTFGQVGPAVMGYLDTATVGTSFLFAPGKAGDYTLVIGGDQSLPGPVSYTISIGAEQPFPAPPAGVALRSVRLR
jgi:hypothetical protein